MLETFFSTSSNYPYFPPSILLHYFTIFYITIIAVKPTTCIHCRSKLFFASVQTSNFCTRLCFPLRASSLSVVQTTILSIAIIIRRTQRRLTRHVACHYQSCLHFYTLYSTSISAALRNFRLRRATLFNLSILHISLTAAAVFASHDQARSREKDILHDYCTKADAACAYCTSHSGPLLHMRRVFENLLLLFIRKPIEHFASSRPVWAFGKSCDNRLPHHQYISQPLLARRRRLIVSSVLKLHASSITCASSRWR